MRASPAARQVRELMRLAFLLDRTYWPYTKWFGTAFDQLPLAADLAPLLEAALAPATYAEREPGLCGAYELLARRHNDLRLTDPIDPTARPFHDRPYRVLDADRFAHPLRDSVADPALRQVPLVGGVDQFADSTDVLASAEQAAKLRAVLN